MKRKLCFSLLLLQAFALTGCNFVDSFTSWITGNSGTGESGKDDSDSKEDDSSDYKKLIIKTSCKLDYYLYDNLDLTGLTVGIVEKENGVLKPNVDEVTDYSLSFSDTSDRCDETYRFRNVGEKTIICSKEGYQSCRFTVTINDVSDFDQSLEINTKDSKTTFELNEKFDSDGLIVSLRTKFHSTDDKSFEENIDGYTLKINGRDASGYTFTSVGEYQVDISYTDNEFTGDTLSIFYGVSCIDKLNSYLPDDIVDDTIVRTADETTANVTISGKSSINNDKGYYSQDEVDVAYSLDQFSKKDAARQVTVPHTGKVPLLVIPVITPGDESKATDDNLAMIRKAFMGNSSDLYFESLHSYYYQSSYGKLDFKVGITDYFDLTTSNSVYSTMAGFIDTTKTDEKKSVEIANLATNWAKTTYNLDMKLYDSNSDGFIDGIWMVNLHEMIANTVFWPFQYYDSSTVKNTNSPNLKVFGWCSIDAINDSYYKASPRVNLNNQDCDAHVLIHETGHMLGLSDYYSYSYANDYCPLGKYDMMDNNVSDQNPYSKLLFSWVTPIIAYGNCTIDLQTLQEHGGVILIPYNDKNYSMKNSKAQLNVFDEYILVDLYTPVNLNSQGYDCYRVNWINDIGVRIYHVDARVCKWTYSDNSMMLYSDPDSPFTGGNTDRIYRLINNSESGDRAEESWNGSTDTKNEFDEIRWISKNGYLSNSNVASRRSLFKAGDSFSLASYSSQFVDNKLDCEKNFSAVVTINSIS